MDKTTIFDMANKLNDSASKAPAADHTEQVSATAPIASDSKTDQPVAGSELTEYKVIISSDEMELLKKYRETEAVGDALDNASHSFKDVPFFGLIYGGIRKILPEGYGTYTMAGLLILIALLSGVGIEIPYVVVPDELTGFTGIVGAALWFLRDAKRRDKMRW